MLLSYRNHRHLGCIEEKKCSFFINFNYLFSNPVKLGRQGSKRPPLTDLGISLLHPSRFYEKRCIGFFSYISIRYDDDARLFEILIVSVITDIYSRYIYLTDEISLSFNKGHHELPAYRGQSGFIIV